MSKSISLRPSEAIAEPRFINTASKRELDNISTMTLDNLIKEAVVPVYDRDADLDMRGVPSAWLACVKKTSKRHLALHALCLASADRRLQQLSLVKQKAQEICDTTGDERGLVWLSNRPPFYINSLAIERRRVRINCWNPEIKLALSGLADEYGITERSIILVYSCKSLLNSDVGILGWRSLLQRDILDIWDKWVSAETMAIIRLFGLSGDLLEERCILHNGGEF